MTFRHCWSSHCALPAFPVLAFFSPMLGIRRLQRQNRVFIELFKLTRDKSVKCWLKTNATTRLSTPENIRIHLSWSLIAKYCTFTPLLPLALELNSHVACLLLCTACNVLSVFMLFLSSLSVLLSHVAVLSPSSFTVCLLLHLLASCLAPISV